MWTGRANAFWGAKVSRNTSNLDGLLISSTSVGLGILVVRGVLEEKEEEEEEEEEQRRENMKSG